MGAVITCMHNTPLTKCERFCVRDRCAHFHRYHLDGVGRCTGWREEVGQFLECECRGYIDITDPVPP